MLDQTDLAILKLLQQNSRMQWREIGEQVHLTGQAVGHRIRKMEEQGIIEADRISGEGCYLLKVNVPSSPHLNQLLDDILKYANYRVNISLGKVK